MAKIRVTVWNEGRHEKTHPEVAKVYPKGIHGQIAAALKKFPDIELVKTATVDEDAEHGLAERERQRQFDVVPVAAQVGIWLHNDVQVEITRLA